MSGTSEGEPKREPPDVTTLLGVLHEAGVDYVVTGSTAAMLHGVELVPGDLDITPALDVDNLTRLAACSSRSTPAKIRGRPSDTGCAETMASSTGSRARPRRKPSRHERAGDPILRRRIHSITSCSQDTEHSTLSRVVSGTYDDLIARAVALDIEGYRVWVESIGDLLTTLTIPRRAKDRDRVDQLRAMQRTGG